MNVPSVTGKMPHNQCGSTLSSNLTGQVPRGTFALHRCADEGSRCPVLVFHARRNDEVDKSPLDRNFFGASESDRSLFLCTNCASVSDDAVHLLLWWRAWQPDQPSRYVNCLGANVSLVT